MYCISKYLFYLENNSILKKTYSPLSTIPNSSAANMISRIFDGFPHIITTVKRKCGGKKNIVRNLMNLKTEFADMNNPILFFN